jgi:DNA polymerase V
LVALSANFALYGDLSDRMMSLSAGLGPEQEIYSIDECFISLDGVRGDLRERALKVRARILRWIGIPTCIGVAPTKTLAKFANHVAKSAERKPGSYPAEHAQACDLSKLDRADIDALLAATEVGEVWGIGHKIGEQCRAAGVTTALDLARLDPASVRARFSVVVERTVRELRGEPCIHLEDSHAPKKQIACTRSFGGAVQTLTPLAEAISEFATRAAEKLRAQDSQAGEVLVFIRTSPFRKTPQYSRSVVVPLRRPSSDTSAIVEAALRGLKAVYRRGFQYAKAGVMLMDISTADVEQFELLLEPAEDKSVDERARLMQTLDTVNDRWGRGTLKVGSARIGQVPRNWSMKQERRTPEYTTAWKDLPLVRA